MYCSATDQPWRSLDRFSGFCGDSSTLRLIKDPSNPCFALIMFADDIDVSIGCSVFPAEITGWTPLLCHTFKVARQLHYTQEGAFAWFKTRRTPLLCHALMAAREPGCLGLKHIDIDRREHYPMTAAARHLSRKVWVIELWMQITRAGSHDSGDVKHQQSKKTVPSSKMTQRSHVFTPSHGERNNCLRLAWP